MRQFPSAETLASYSTFQLHALDIRDKDEEMLVQAEVNRRLAKNVSPTEVDLSDIDTDAIQSPEDEAEAQEKVNERVSELKEERETKLEKVEEEIQIAADAPKPLMVNSAGDILVHDVLPKGKPGRPRKVRLVE